MSIQINYVLIIEDNSNISVDYTARTKSDFRKGNVLNIQKIIFCLRILIVISSMPLSFMKEKSFVLSEEKILRCQTLYLV